MYVLSNMVKSFSDLMVVFPYGIFPGPIFGKYSVYHLECNYERKWVIIFNDHNPNSEQGNCNLVLKQVVIYWK